MGTEQESSGLSPSELQSRAFRGASWSSLSSLAALPLAIVVSAVLARSLGPEGYARFALLTFVVPLIYTASDLGYAQATTRSAAQAFSAGDLATTRELIGKAQGWNVLRIPLLIVVTLAIARPGPGAALALVVFLVTTQAASGLNFSLNAENRGAVMAKVAFVQFLVASGVSVAAALAGASPTTVWALSVSSGAVAAPAWVIVANPALRRAAIVPRLPRALPAGFWRFALTAAATTLGTVLVFSRSEILVLEAYGEQRALAIFALAYGLSQRLTTPLDTLLGSLAPALSGLASAHPQRLQAGFNRSLRLSAAGTAFVAGSALVGTALAAPLIFGAEYAGVGPVFAALAAVSLFRAAAQPYTALAYAAGRPGVVLRALAAALALDVALTVALVPVVGIWGAVIANGAGGIVALWLAARAITGPGSLRRSGTPAARLVAVASASCAAAYAAGVGGGVLHAGVGAAAAFAAGTAAFVVLSGGARRLLPPEDAGAVLRQLPAGLGLARLLGRSR